MKLRCEPPTFVRTLIWGLWQYHDVCKEYLPLYMNEFSWRFKSRKNPNMFANYYDVRYVAAQCLKR
ncbi:MAG TPA: hypothetical protein VJN94_03310 [Candidatus Binataceae bacterium]|nr:hypothetical protein [Candidatus Binataceae bacterium]